MSLCPACAASLPDGARFCPSCGFKLASDVGLRPALERKVVTCLFCDLVGFTPLSEGADPEEVDQVLHEYARVAKHAVEIHGGIVEKFIGDAVVGVFGVPAAHEDDAERAVHAALRIRQDVAGVSGPDGAPIHVHIGINTGETVARLRTPADSGEGFLAGDTVNTTARLQAAAPPDGVLVGPTTYALTSRLFDYEELDPIDLKGKSGPVPAWQALRAVAQTHADAMVAYPTSFLGRRDELAALDEVLEETVRSGHGATALITGEPGIGKSRLVAEFSRLLDQRPLEVTWRQGRCLPYGEGVTFWPLREIVKAQTGILDTDGLEATARKLSRALPEGPDKAWLQSRLRPLVGLDAPSVSQEENFAAWSRFVEQLARRRPTVIVVEDLHWADDSMLEFLRRLAASDSGLPLLVITTARTQFLERRPDFVASAAQRHLSLAPLTEKETTRMLTELAGHHQALDPLKASIVERGGGNPLYTEELLRLIKERGQLVATTLGVGSDKDASLALPASLHAVVAARIDALPPRHKEILASAAVIGRRFWDGAVAAAMGDDGALDDDLRQLAAAELIRCATESSMAGQREFVFWHAVTLDVAYQQLTRASRAEKHQSVARWLEGLMGERADDLADVLAHHYATALDLARLAHKDRLADALLEPSVHSLRMAGDRALRFDSAAAERHYDRALRLLPSESPHELDLVAAHAKALQLLGRYRDASEALAAAAAGYAAHGRRHDALLATAHDALARIYMSEAPTDIQQTAQALLASEEASFEVLDALEDLSCAADCASDHALSLALAERSLTLLADLGLPPAASSLSRRGYARCALGDRGGLADLDAALEMAATRSSGRELCALYANVGEATRLYRGVRAALDLHRAALAIAQQMTDDPYAVCFSRCTLFLSLVAAGEWSEALADARDLDRALEEHGDLWSLQLVRATTGLLEALRGECRAGAESAAWAERSSRNRGQSGVRAQSLVSLAVVESSLGDGAGAVTLLEEYVAMPSSKRSDYERQVIPEAMRCAVTLGRTDIATRCAEGLLGARPYDSAALELLAAHLSKQSGDLEGAAAQFGTAAECWAKLGFAYELGQARLGQARCVVGLGDVQRAAALHEARGIFARMGAKPALLETESLIRD